MLKDNLTDIARYNDRGEYGNFHKFNYFSTHDSTVLALLTSLNLVYENNYRWPPFAAALKYELWKNGKKMSDKSKDALDNYYVRIFYLGQVCE